MTYFVQHDLTINSSSGAVPAAAESFKTEKQLIALATGWPMERLVAIWNHLPGTKPVKKFTDRKTGPGRIWTAVQNLTSAARTSDGTGPARSVADLVVPPAAATAPPSGAEPAPQPTLAEQTANVAPGKTKATATMPRAGEPASAPATRKKDAVLALLRRREGATMLELMNEGDRLCNLSAQQKGPRLRRIGGRRPSRTP